MQAPSWWQWRLQCLPRIRRASQSGVSVCGSNTDKSVFFFWSGRRAMTALNNQPDKPEYERQNIPVILWRLSVRQLTKLRKIKKRTLFFLVQSAVITKNGRNAADINFGKCNDDWIQSVETAHKKNKKVKWEMFFTYLANKREVTTAEERSSQISCLAFLAGGVLNI